MKRIILGFALLFFVYGGFTQKRYLDYVFEESEISVTRDVEYGKNYTVLSVLNPTVGHTIKASLKMDIYAPEEEEQKTRPLILYFHTGNFLPVQANGGVNGTIRDSSTVFACKKLARLGYVVASVDYRQGWLPTDPNQGIRNFTLINAAYRGVQDAHTAIRFFKKSVEENGNPYGIDADKIVLWGQGTGGYVAVNTGALDNTLEIVTTTHPQDKFIGLDVDGNPAPMVQDNINGNITATNRGIAPPGFEFPPAGDSLCTPNHVGYDSEVKLIVNMAGAIGDISWIDEKTPPMVLFHVPSDAFAPYDSRVLSVPTAGDALPVVEVQGSYRIAKRLNELGINDVFNDIDDVYTQAAKAASAKAHNIFAAGENPETQNGHDYYEGLFPLNTKINKIAEGPFSGTYIDGAPWDFWDVTYWSSIPNQNFGGASYHVLASLSNPEMSKEKSLTYLDTCVFYFAPRAYRVLDLEKASTKLLKDNEVGLKIFPNPSSDMIRIETDWDFPMKQVRVYQWDGKLIRSQQGIHGNRLDMEVYDWRAGLHIVHIQTDKGIVVKKLVIQ